MIPNDLKVIGEREVSALLGVSTSTLRHWRRKSVRKGPKFLKLDNGSVRYRLRDIEQYQEERVVETEGKVIA